MKYSLPKPSATITYLGGITYGEILNLSLIFLIAASLRFLYPDIVNYRQDHADLTSLAQDIAEGISIPLLGIPSSARVPNSPMTAYVVAIPFFFSDNPVFATLFIAGMNVTGVGLLWFLARRYFNSTVALIAGLAYAVNPWAVGYSRSIWAQNYYTPIFLAGLLCGLMGFVEGKRWGQVLCLPLLVIAMQIHLAAVALFPIFLWLLWIGRKRIHMYAIIISFFLAILTLIPYILGIIEYRSQDVGVVVEFQPQQREISLRGFVKPYGQMVWLITGLGQEQYIARERAEEFLSAVGMPVFIWIFLGVFTGMGMATSWRRYRLEYVILVLLWAFVPVLILTLPVIDVAPHYFVASIAAIAILNGMGIDWILDVARRRPNFRMVRYVIWLLLVTIFTTQSVFIVRARHFADETYLPTQFGFGPSIHFLFNVREALRDYDDVVLIGNGEWVDISAHGSAVWASLLRQSATCVRDLLVSENVAVLPSGPFAAVYTPRTPPSERHDRLYQQGQSNTVSLRPEEGDYVIFDHRQPLQWPNPVIQFDEPQAFASGVALVGYDLENTTLTLTWSLPQKTTGTYNYVITYMDGNDNIIKEQVVPLWAGKNWCGGDRLVSWTDIEPSKTTTYLHIGLERGSQRLSFNSPGISIPVTMN